jgi:YhcH/YjgK/YiaL family protein
MIYDKIENWATYAGGKKKVWEKAFNFISDFSADIADGRHELDGQLMYANVQSYETRALHDSRVEMHREYIDIQVLVSGQEVIFYNSISTLKRDGKFNDAKDCGFYERNMKTAVPLPMEAGFFAIFFPEEGHMPGVNFSEVAEPVRKIVVKIHKSLIFK